MSLKTWLEHIKNNFRFPFSNSLNIENDTIPTIRMVDIAAHPGGRLPADGPENAFEIRERFVVPALRKNDKLIVDLSYCAYGSNFLDELFGGLLFHFTRDELDQKLRIKCRHSMLQEIWGYIETPTGLCTAPNNIEKQQPISIRSSSSAEMIQSSSNLLHENNWVSLFCMRRPEKHIYEYVYSKETRCDGIVAFLPFRINKGVIEVLIRYEATPCWDGDKQVGSSFTGGIDHGSNPVETTIKEVLEETGFSVDQTELISLGQTFGIKSSDTIYHLYAIDLTNKTASQALTIETELEQSAFNRWVPISETSYIIPDAIYGILAFRLIHMLMNNPNIK